MIVPVPVSANDWMKKPPDVPEFWVIVMTLEPTPVAVVESKMLALLLVIVTRVGLVTGAPRLKLPAICKFLPIVSGAEAPVTKIPGALMVTTSEAPVVGVVNPAVAVLTETVVEPPEIGSKSVLTWPTPPLKVNGDAMIAPMLGLELTTFTEAVMPPRRLWAVTTLPPESSSAEMMSSD